MYLEYAYNKISISCAFEVTHFIQRFLRRLKIESSSQIMLFDLYLGLAKTCKTLQPLHEYMLVEKCI